MNSALARALFNEPKLLLCDEPTGALDSGSGKVVMDVFRRLNEDAGVTILMVTHDPAVAEQTQRTIRISDGAIHEEADA